METIKIQYFASHKDDQPIAVYDTGDPATPENLALWDAHMSDPAVEHPDCPDHWECYEITT